VLDEDHDMMEIRCTFVECTYSKVIRRQLSGTNNYQIHYRKEHPGIPTTQEEALHAKEQRVVQQGQSKGFFDKPAKEQSHNQRFRHLLLQWIIKNNLSFSIVDQPETKELFSFLSPSTTLISTKTLMADMKKKYEVGENIKRDELVEDGGRLVLTTDAWDGGNKNQYIAVTVHGKTRAGDMFSFLIDIIELTDPIHDGHYLCQKLVSTVVHLRDVDLAPTPFPRPLHRALWPSHFGRLAHDPSSQDENTQCNIMRVIRGYTGDEPCTHDLLTNSSVHRCRPSSLSK
jgi:hypothetical protein